MDTLLDGIFHGLFSAVDPLGMVLRTLMALLADALAQVASGMYSSLFAVTTVDLQQAAVANIWRITTGLSASLASMSATTSPAPTSLGLPRALFTAEEVADAIAVSEAMVRQLTCSGDLPCRRIGFEHDPRCVQPDDRWSSRDRVRDVAACQNGEVGPVDRGGVDFDQCGAGVADRLREFHLANRRVLTSADDGP